ncbi:MAG: alpha-amylase family glycosyl hydrolase [Oscillospiraceae bacterium]
MEAGDWWQLSCVPKNAETPEWAQGAIIYQIFPDRFAKSGNCDLTGKLEPYTVHQNWSEEVHWQPTERGEVLNNDFFGGNFRGITEKLPYLASLGVTILYLNPISKAFSSHRYDTGDYKTPDPMLGTHVDFIQLCREARKLNIHVFWTAFFHTGPTACTLIATAPSEAMAHTPTPTPPTAAGTSFITTPTLTTAGGILIPFPV